MSANVAAHKDTGAVGARLSVMMFLQFFVWGAWYVSITGWLNVANLSGITGWVYTVGPIAAIISPLFLGTVADRFLPTQRALGIMHLLGGLLLLLVPTVAASAAGVPQTFTNPVVLLLLGHMLCYMPTLGLSNTVSFHHVDNPEKQFPLIRVFGTIGWIVGNLAVSYLPGGDKSPSQFYLAGGVALLLGLYSFTLPHTPPPAQGKKSSIGQILGTDALKLFRSPSYFVFIICSFLICIPLAAYYNQARNFVEYVGFAQPTATMSFGQMSEIFFMIIMPLMFLRLGVKWMLLAGMAAWVARYGLFSIAADTKTQWMVIGGVILHGICYDFFFVTGQIYVDRTAPAAIRGQAQGLLVLITQGLGLGIGAQVVAKVVASNTAGTVANWHMIWLIPCIAAAVILVIFAALFKEAPTPRAGASFDEEIGEIPPASGPIEPAPAP